MIAVQSPEVCHPMTRQSMDAFLLHEKVQNRASENLQRRYRCAVYLLFDFLPADKVVTRPRLLSWRAGMEDRGYASVTIQNYVKYINRYLDFSGCSALRFHQGKAKDITGMTFGYLTAIAPTGEKNRDDIVWSFQCKCGQKTELPATRVLCGNTLSCGCLKTASLKAANKYYAGTSLTQSITETVKSTRSASGYTGVSPKNGKWLAYIRYKGVQYSLGCYSKLDDAVKARAKAKELVIADAQGLLNFYSALEKTFPQRPNKRTEPKKIFPSTNWTVHDTPASAAKRSDNQSGHTGVSFHRNKWDATICYRGVRYRLGQFETIEPAIAARESAEKLLKEDPERFVLEFSKK